MSESLADDGLEPGCENCCENYRATTVINNGLLESIRSQVDEQLHVHAIDRLSSIVAAGGSSTPDKPVPYPPATHTRYLTTLIAHPYYTTQHSARHAHPREPLLAYRLVKRILSTLGPAYTDLASTYVFSGERTTNTSTRRNGGGSGSPTTSTPHSKEHLAGELANEESLFVVGEDLWRVVGWGFTCSVLHPKRWEWYRLLLDVLIDALERDLSARQGFVREAGTDETDTLSQSLIAQLLPEGKGTQVQRKVLEAIFADGSTVKGRMVWADEGRRRRRKRMSDNGISAFLGAEDTDTDDDEREKREADPEAEKALETEALGRGESDVQEKQEGNGEEMDLDDDDEEVAPNAAETWGGMEAVLLRQRFLALVCCVCDVALSRDGSGHHIWADPADFYMSIMKQVLHLPLPTFTLFLSPFLPLPAVPTSHATLVFTIAEEMASPARLKVKLPSGVSPDNISADMLILRFLPFPANTAEMERNAKFSILLDTMLRMLASRGLLAYSEELAAAVETGIDERRKKVEEGAAAGVGNGRGRKRKVQQETEAVMMAQTSALWRASEERLRASARVLKRAAERAETTAD